uniref:ATP-grasp domain-containing protein n=1 Tax=viral metagenome TaxID=1070528 RepID=A0A6H2A5C9_9ZZZZ
MTIYILSYSHSPYGDNSSTAWKLAEEAEWEFINKYSNPEFTRENDILIRWGIHNHPDWDYKVKGVLNCAPAIKLNCCKALAHYIMANNGVTAPRIEFLPGKISIYPSLSRWKYHSQAKDIKFIHREEELSSRDWKAFYYTELIKSEIEYRFHILRGRCIRMSRKLPMRRFPFVDPIIRSFQRGWKLRDKDGWEHLPDIEEKAIEQSVKAVEALGLDFGAVDVVIQEETNIPYVLEVNSAPRLNALGRRKYIKAFKRMLENAT